MVWFTAAVALMSLVISLLALPFASLPWWRVFRRCASISALLVLLWTVSRSGLTWRSLGLIPWQEGKGFLPKGFAVGFLMVSLMIAGYLATGICATNLTDNPRRLVLTVVLFLPAAFLISVLEELIFRGYLLQQLAACSKSFAILGTSVGYALVHMKPTWVWPGSAMELVGLGVLGAVLAIVVLRSGHLYAAIGLHASLAFWARLNKLLVVFPPDSPWQWLVGSSRLVNGVLPWCILVLIGVVLVRRNRRAMSP